MMRFLAVVVSGLSLIAPGAHAFELANKIGLPKAEYFIVQHIYSGWWIVGLLLPLAFLMDVGNAVALRGDKTAMMLSIAAAAHRIGPCSPTIGKPCARSGSIRMRSTPR